jgi:hypothetical protein
MASYLFKQSIIVGRTIQIFQEGIMRTVEITDLDFDQNIAPTAQISGGVGLYLSTSVAFTSGVKADAFVKAKGGNTYTAVLTGTLSLKNAYGSVSAGAAGAAGGATSGASVIAGNSVAVGVKLN